MKYVGEGAENSGGIFHALVELSLPDDILADLAVALEEEVPGARIAGPVPLMEALKDGESGVGSFQIVSSILNDTEGDNPFTQTVITSSHAPLLPGAKAAIAAKLNQNGATLLWESLTGPTSDISVTVNAYYEAKVKGYNAVVKAEMSRVYEHFSKIRNNQEGFQRNQVRNITDELVQSQVLEIEVFDRSEGLGIKTGEMDAILNLVTDKLTEIMFDSKMGWAKMPEKEVAVEKNQIPGRQKKGFLRGLISDAEDLPYKSDNQFVLKDRKDVQTQSFYLNLSKTTTVKVPVHTSGNLGGLYDELGEDERYFRIVDLDDPDFQKRDVHFQIDGNYVDAFDKLINFAAVNFRKVYGEGQADKTGELVFKRSDLEAGTDLKSMDYARLGIEGKEWLDYEYQISWSIMGLDQPVRYPATEGEWVSSQDPAISLIPPFRKRNIDIDADRTLFKDEGVRSAQIKFFVVLGGQPRVLTNVILRADDAESISQVNLYHDADQPVAYQITWYSTAGKIVTEPTLLEDDYFFLSPPDKKQFGSTSKDRAR